jgi:aryl-alcohol dehydrogenase-like predicted oxidoreductase
VATKGGLERPGPDQWVPNGRPERLRLALEGSLRRLRLPQIDLYQLHRVDRAIPADDQFGVLQAMRAEGLVRHIGLSEVDITQIEHARRFFPVVSVQNQYKRHGFDIGMPCSSTAPASGLPSFPGILSGPAVFPATVRDSSFVVCWDVVRQLRFCQRLRGVTGQRRRRVAIAWLLQRSPIILPIPGTSTRAHLEENLAAARLRLTPADVAALDTVALVPAG